MITTIITAMLTSKAAQAISALLVALVAWFGNGALQRRKGRLARDAKAKQEDFEHAQDIVDSVSRNRADSLRKMDGRGYRD